MKNAVRRIKKVLVCAFSLAVACTLFIAFGIGSSAEENKLVIADSNGSDYVIIAGVGASDSKIAYDLSEKIYSVTRADVYDYPTSRAESEKEILVGETNRQISLDLISAVNEKFPDADAVAWGFAVREAQFAFYANCDEALEFCLDEIYEKYLKDGSFAVPDDLFTVSGMSRAEYDEYVAEQERIEAEERERRRREKIEFYKSAIASEFENSDFGPYITNMTEETKVTYDSIEVYPTVGQHPRVLVNAEMIEKIRVYLENNNSNAESILWSLADSEIANDGKLPPSSEAAGVRGVNNFDLAILRTIQIKAFAYLITGDELYALEAVYAMKNYLVTLDVQYITSDGTREFGYCMYIAACVYDWCYDILSEDDKFQLIAGVEHLLCRGTTAQPEFGSYGGVKMEMGFPPTAQGALVGHGSERALMRDYLSMAIAIFDEERSWYDYCAGRYYAEFVPARKIYYASGMVPQGMSEYATGRYMSDLYSAMLIKAISGDIPFSDDMRDVVITMASYETNGNYIFSAGDHRLNKDSFNAQLGYCAMMSAYLFDDPVALAICYKSGHGNTIFYSGTFNLSPIESIICMQNGLEPIPSKYDEMNTIVYNGGIFGQIIARESWDGSTAAAVLMKIGTRHTANHDHYASGSFQIYYKGMLSSDTGVYDSYGTTHHVSFHKATISHNSLLIYNPALAADSPYYVGGQRDGFGEPKTNSAWSNSTYTTAELLGYAYGYDAEGNSKYSYISGDIAPAYTSETVDFVGRTMLSVFTGDESFPMLFFVFDRIDTPDPTFKKTFLLQITGNTEPVIEGNTVTTVNGNGKLVLQSLLGGDNITPIGGKGQNYLVNGVQLTSKGDDDTWGRVEISPNLGNKTDLMLNVMYVADRSQTQALTAELLDVKSGNASAAKIANTVAVFANSNLPETNAVSFTNEGEGIFEYYVGNLSKGTWAVKLGEEKLGTVYAANDSKMVTFKAPAGEITLEPSSDVNAIPESKIKYVTDKGILPADAPEKYQHGTSLELPTNITRGTDLFLGWYLDAEYTERVTHIPETATGLFTVYAKWSKIYVNENYDSFDVDLSDVTSSSSIGQGISLNSGSGSLNTLKTDNEKGTLTWTAGGKGPAVNVNNANFPFSKINSHQISYEISLAKLPDVKNMSLNLRVRDTDKTGTVTLANVSGTNITLGGVTIATISEVETTIRLVLDFATAKVYAYDEDGDVITASPLTVPEGYASAIEWQSAFTREVFNMYAAGAGTIIIGKIFIAESNIFSDGTPPSDDYVVYPDGVGLPEGYIKNYTPGVAAKLPGSATRDGFYFDGWYADEALTARITEIPASASGPFAVYAKWNRVYVNESWDDFEIDAVDVLKAASVGLGLALNNGNSQLNDVKSDNVNGTLTWTVDGKGPAIVAKNKNNPIKSLAEDCYTIEISMAKLASANAPRLTFRVRDDADGTKKTINIAELSGGILKVGTTEILTLTEELQTARLVVDFGAAKIYAFDEYGNGIASADITAPDGYESVAQWKDAFVNELLNIYAGGGGTIVLGHVYIAEGNLYGEYVYTDQSANVITYPSDADLPSGAPTSYKTGEEVKLPESAAKDGFIFDGWYSDEALTSEITKIAAGTSGEVKVYAKWLRVYANETWDSFEINQSDVVSAGSVGNGIGLNGSGGVLNDLTTDNEKGTLTWTVDGKGPGLIVKNKNYPIASLAENQLAIEMSLAKSSDVNAPRLTFRIRDNEKSNTLTVAQLVSNELTVGNTKVLTLTEELQTVRIVIDFEAETIYVYDENLNGIASADMTIPESFESGIAWRNNFTFEEVLNIYANNGGSLVIGHVYIAEGNPYGEYKYVNPDGNKIIYPDDVTLPSDAPISYQTGKETPLPTTAAKSGSYFLGWYSDEALTTPISAIPADATGEFKVFAKWAFAYVNESYDTYQINESGVTSKSSVGNSLALNGGEGSLNDLTSDNENGVLIWTSTGQGPALVVNNTTNAMSKQASGLFTFEFSFEYVDGIEMLDLQMRTRDANKREIALARVTDGTVSFGGADLYTVKPDEQVTLRLVVDFKNAMVYFYDAELNAYHTRSFSHPDSYVSASDWQSNFTKEVVNIRAEGSGTILVHHLVITEGNLYGDYEAPDASENVIIYPDGEVLPEGAPTSYTRGETVVLPTLEDKDGLQFEGWYLDEDLTVHVTEVPKTASGALKVYAKWSEEVSERNAE